jgi:hypothetical protein
VISYCFASAALSLDGGMQARHDVVGFGTGARENLRICRVGRGRHATTRRQIGPTDGWVGARQRGFATCSGARRRAKDTRS